MRALFFVRARRLWNSWKHRRPAVGALRRFPAALAVLAAVVLFVGPAWAQDPDDPVNVRVEPPAGGIQAGKSGEVAVVFDIERPWHIYDKDSEWTATRVALSGPAGWTFSTPVFPPPVERNLKALGGTMKLHDGTVRVRVRATAPKDAAPGEATITARVSYGSCNNDTCLAPVEGRVVSAVVQVLPASAGTAGGTTNDADPGETAKAPQPPGSGAENPATAPPASRDAPLKADGAKQTAKASTASSSAREAEISLWRFWEVDWMNMDPSKVPLLAKLLLSLLLGLASTFTPCVYPMIPITVSYFGGGVGASYSRGQALKLAAVYMLGIALSFMVVGLVFGLAFQETDLGSLQGEWWFAAALSVVFIGLALSMFGLYELRLPSSVVGRLQSSGKRGVAPTFLLGSTLGLVALPCVGPFVAFLLLVVARDPLSGALCFLIFGMGLGFLFLLMALGVQKLPRSGAWMVRFKYACGWVIIGVAGYYLSLPTGLPDAMMYAFAAVGLAAGVHFIYLDVKSLGSTQRVGIVHRGFAFGALAIAGLCAGSIAGAFDAGASDGKDAGNANVAGIANANAPGTVWLADWEAAHKKARAEGKPLFADFRADWCIPCREMESGVFPDPAVMKALARFVTVRMDCTKSDSEGARIKNKVLGSRTMPYLVFYDSDGTFRKDLAQGKAVGKDALLALLKKVR